MCSSMDKDQIDSLIWGDFETKIIEMGIPLWTGGDIMKSIAMDGALALFTGFIHFMQFKRGLKPNFGFYDGVSFFKDENVVPDFGDPSWWVNNLEYPDMIEYSFQMNINSQIPDFWKQHIDKNGNEQTIRILMDTFAFFEAGKILNETKLEDETKYSFSDISKEFHITSDNLTNALLDFKFLENKDHTNAYTLVFRPSKLVEYFSRLNEYLTSLVDFPDQVIRKEEWEKMSRVDQIGILGKTEIIECNEENIRELLKKHNIKIPNITFVTFYEYLKDKLDPNIEQEWINIRDRYISNLKKTIIEPYQSKNYNRAKKFLSNARKSFESKHHTESVTFSSNAIEEALNVFLKKPEMELGRKIFAIQKNKDLGKHVVKLNFIRFSRNDTVHPNEFDIDENTASKALEMADEFLTDIQKTI